MEHQDWCPFDDGQAVDYGAFNVTTEATCSALLSSESMGG